MIHKPFSGKPVAVCFALLVCLILAIPQALADTAKKKPKGKPVKAPAVEISREETIYETLKARYLKLRNTDPTVRRQAEWNQLIKEMAGYASDWPRSKNAPAALFNAASLAGIIYGEHRSREFLEKNTELLSKLIDRYPSDNLADDALLKLGDLFLYELKDEEQAELFYQQVRSRYPDGDMYDVAGVRLKAVADGSYKKRARDKDDGDDEEQNGAGKGSARYVVVIDPGHGGEDQGAVGYGGLLEKDVALDVSIELSKLLQQDSFAKVRLTRTRDEFIPLIDRTGIANESGADIFVSLHANASPSKKLTGLEVYYLDNSNDKASRALAARENESIRFEGPEADLQYMLSDLIQNVKLEDSILLANFIRRSIVSAVSAAGYRVKDLGVKKAPFYVLVGAHMPCVLVEMSFIDNPEDGRNLSSREYRKSMASGLNSGIRGYLAGHGHKTADGNSR